MLDLDGTDLRILGLLQEDASQSVAAIAERVHLSNNACWHRIKRLEEAGIIQKRVALLDAARVGAGLTMFVLVRAAEHSQEWFDHFAATVRAIPSVTEFHRTSGEVDYLLKLQLPDVASYDEVYKLLIGSIRCSEVRAVFSMEELKRTTSVPLPKAAT
ncbi:MAG TPA: Lrp/AsnC family transcriptional regulator [Steroidobacteraceae bacterium]|jgi:Lrp/AsnC family transcriptional regulator|nr:Lrp/AsnC family transcriptional regulator [Steroidobacteraceae bacterium]